MMTTFRAKLTELLRQYYFVGGMPEAVLSFSKEKDYIKVRAIHERLLSTYEQDFSKHAPYEIVPRIRMIWQSIPAQLSKENKKFVYGALKPGARAKEFEMAMTWLIDTGLLHKIHRITKPGIPLISYMDFAAFKLYFVDIGLLGAMGSIDAKTLLEGNAIFEEFKGAMTEQYVLQQLKTKKKLPIYYWSNDKSTAEIDFLIQLDGEIIPIEVKAQENLQAKSLKSYYQQFNPKTSIRTSMSDFRIDDWLTNVPLYAIGDYIDKSTQPPNPSPPAP
jgi:predicted AAA+ superfamily ATPase